MAIENISFPHTDGYNYQAYVIKAFSDKPFFVIMATFWMCHKILIAGSEVQGITKVEIQKADESLSGVAYLEFPAYNQNKPFDAEKKWKRGDEVIISLGYNNEYQENLEDLLGLFR
jgi:hypothetical protein